MVTFIQTDDGFVNSADVYRITEQRKPPQNDQKFGEPMLRLHYRGAGDERLSATVSTENLDTILDSLTTTVVPAAAGTFVTVLTYYDDDDDTHEPVSILRYPVAAWRVEGTTARPILPDETFPRQQTVLIELGDGKLLSPYNTTYDSLEEAKAAVLRSGRRLRDSQKQK